MSDLQALGLALGGFVVLLNSIRAVRKGGFGPLDRIGDPLAFWCFMSVVTGFGVLAIALSVSELLGVPVH